MERQMRNLILSANAFFLLLSFATYAQQTSSSTTSASITATPIENMCVERGLKCCNKARGKRAEKIRLKCEKKYKCNCPTLVNK